MQTPPACASNDIPHNFPYPVREIFLPPQVDSSEPPVEPLAPQVDFSEPPVVFFPPQADPSGSPDVFFPSPLEPFPLPVEPPTSQVESPTSQVEFPMSQAELFQPPVELKVSEGRRGAPDCPAAEPSALRCAPCSAQGARWGASAGRSGGSSAVASATAAPKTSFGHLIAIGVPLAAISVTARRTARAVTRLNVGSWAAGLSGRSRHDTYMPPAGLDHVRPWRP